MSSACHSALLSSQGECKPVTKPSDRSMRTGTVNRPMSAQVCLVPLLRMDEGAIFSCSSRGQTCIPALKSSNQHLERLLRDWISNCGMQNHIRIGKLRKPIPMPDVESSNRSDVGAVHENAIEEVRDCSAPCPDAKFPPTKQPGVRDSVALTVRGGERAAYCLSNTSFVGGSVVPAVRVTTTKDFPSGATVQLDMSNGFPFCVRVILKLCGPVLVREKEAPAGIPGPVTFPGLPSNVPLAFSLKSGSSKARPFSISLSVKRLGALPLNSLFFQVPPNPWVPPVRT